MTLIVQYYDIGIALNPSLSELDANSYQMTQPGQTEAVIVLGGRDWDGFRIRLTGDDFLYVSGEPWSGTISGLEILAPSGDASLSFANSNAGAGLGVDIADFWQTLASSGARAAQALFGTDFKIHGSPGNDSISDWYLHPSVIDRTLDTGDGDDIVWDVRLAHNNESYGEIYLGDGNDYSEGSSGRIYGGAGNDEISSGWRGAGKGGALNDMIGGDGDDIFHNYSANHGFAKGGAGYDIEYFQSAKYGVIMTSSGIEKFVFLNPLPYTDGSQYFGIRGLTPGHYVSTNPLAKLSATINVSGDYRNTQFEGWAEVALTFNPGSGANIIATERADVVVVGQGSGAVIATLGGDDDVSIQSVRNINGSDGNDIDLGAGQDRVTIKSNSRSWGDDTIRGGEGDDVFLIEAYINTGPELFAYDGGLGRDSLIYAGGGDLSLNLADEAASGRLLNFEIIKSGDGNDTLTGTAADETFSAGAGRNEIDGGAGSDTVDYSGQAGTMSVTLDGSAQTLVRIGGVGHDAVRNIENIIGGSGSDSVVGDASDNVFAGGLGNDTFHGGDGVDTFVIAARSSDSNWDVDAQNAQITLTSSGGVDVIKDDVEHFRFDDTTLSYADLAALAGPRIVGTNAGETITGTAADERIFGLGGADWIRPGGGNDTVDGGDGYDMIDFLNVAAPAGLTNADFMLRLDLGAGIADIFGGDRTIMTNIERATGTIHSDLMRGDAGDNHLRSQGNYDWFIATEGNDTLDGGSGLDMVSFEEWGGNSLPTVTDFLGPIPAQFNGVHVDLADPSKNAGPAAGQTLISIERVTGSSYQDIFYGDGGENTFRGLGGYDIFVGSPGGRERYYGDAGIDTVSYFSASAGIGASLRNGGTLDGEPAGYGTRGDAALDLYFSIENLIGSRHDDSLTGNDLINQLSGLGGDDTIYGYGGNDRIRGGAGNDTIDGGAGSDFAIFSGQRADYSLTRSSGSDVSVDGLDGLDSLSRVEYFVFDDQTVTIWDLNVV